MSPLALVWAQLVHSFFVVHWEIDKHKWIHGKVPKPCAFLVLQLACLLKHWSEPAELQVTSFLARDSETFFPPPLSLHFYINLKKRHKS